MVGRCGIIARIRAQEFHETSYKLFELFGTILYKSIIAVIRRYIVPRMMSFWTLVLVLYDIIPSTIFCNIRAIPYIIIPQHMGSPPFLWWGPCCSLSLFSVLWYSSSSCLCLWIFHYWLPLRFSLTFICIYL